MKIRFRIDIDKINPRKHGLPATVEISIYRRLEKQRKWDLCPKTVPAEKGASIEIDQSFHSTLNWGDAMTVEDDEMKVTRKKPKKKKAKRS